jgi:predicted nucleic acid-binding protein
LLVDSGPLVALLNERDQYHAVCIAQAKQRRGRFKTCWPVITETAHLLGNYPRAVQRLLSWIQTREIEILEVSASDAEGISELLSRYPDQHFDFADACLMYLADRESIVDVFTIDHRHFSVYRTKRRQPLTIIPASLQADA